MKVTCEHLILFFLAVFVMVANVYAYPYRTLKSNIPKYNINREEPDIKIQSSSRESCPVIYPMHVDDNTWFALIDSSANGYGMVSSVTRPINVNFNGKWLLVYRQFAGVGATHGQIGAAYSINGEDWQVQYNINPPWGGTHGPGSYPSAVATSDYPYAFWINNGNQWLGSGGRPSYSYDEFGWDGQSWLLPMDVDPFFSADKDMKIGSVAHGFDATSGNYQISAVYDDWTRGGSYFFTSEPVSGPFLNFGEETLLVNSEDLGSNGFSSASALSVNDNGQGVLGLIGILDGVDMESGTCNPPASNITCNITPLFKLTDDWGETWKGMASANDFYYVPDEVFEEILSQWPSVVVDQCTGEQFEITDFWSWYKFDLRVDMDGNPHIVTSMVAESENYFHFLDGHTGFYHFTIDRDYIEIPGSVNSSTGWNWSYIPLPANDSFRWNRPDGYSYLYGTMVQISLVRDAPETVYIVANIANKGEMSTEDDADGNGLIDDPCQYISTPYELYPNWSEDVWVSSSEDNGSTWIGLLNVTNTSRNGVDDECSPEEQYVHAAHWSDADEVYFMYQQPDWGFNEIGDPLGIDHKNRIFVGSASRFGVYDECWMYWGYEGDVSLDYEINILDIVILANHILEPSLEGCSLETADVNNDGELNILDVIALIGIILGI